MKKLFLLSATIFLSCLANALTLIAPNAPVDVYPTPGTNLVANSAYSVQTSFFFGTGIYDFHVSGWTYSTNTGKIVWRVFSLGAAPPFLALAQGDIAINGTDIEVGQLTLNGDNYILAAYKKNGVGLVFERYIWNGATFVLYSSQILTTTPGKKVNMDTYLGYSQTIVWDEYDANLNTYVIKFMLAQGLSTTQIIKLTGTDGCGIPDVAMSKNTGVIYPNADLEAHIVYAHVPTGSSWYTEIIETVIPFSTVYAANPSSYTGTVEDINSISGAFLPSITIDCPDVCDFAPSANWAYTYCDNGIKVRLVDPAAGVTPITKNIVDGTDYPNFDLTPYGNFYESTIAYDVSQTIHIGGRITGTPGYEGLFGVEISSDGSTLVSPVDYQLISFDATSKSLQFSKDDKYSSFLYAVFSRNGNQPNHMFHQWGDPAFKGSGTVGINSLSQNENLKIMFYPNPFKGDINLSIPAGLLDKDITVTVTAIDGKTLFAGKFNGKQFEANIQRVLSKLPSGTYVLGTSNWQLSYFQNQQIIKID